MPRRSALYTVEKKKTEKQHSREKRENKNDVKRERERERYTHTHTRRQEEALKDPKEKNERLNFHENPACPDHMVGVSINRKRQAKN